MWVISGCEWRRPLCPQLGKSGRNGTESRHRPVRRAKIEFCGHVNQMRIPSASRRPSSNEHAKNNSVTGNGYSVSTARMVALGIQEGTRMDLRTTDIERISGNYFAPVFRRRPCRIPSNGNCRGRRSHGSAADTVVAAKQSKFRTNRKSRKLFTGSSV